MDRVHNETFIYRAEVGTNTHYEDFQERRIERLFTLWAELLRQDTKDEAPRQQFGHSTCAASMALEEFMARPKEQHSLSLRSLNLGGTLSRKFNLAF